MRRPRLRSRAPLTDMPTLLQRLARLAPYVRNSRMGLLAAGLGAVITAVTEPMISDMLRMLLDQGFVKGSTPLWMVPVFIIGLFAVRSLSGFIAQYGLAWTGNRAVQQPARGHLRAPAGQRARALHGTDRQRRDQHPGLRGAGRRHQPVGIGADPGARLNDPAGPAGYLLHLNWQLTLIVALLFPAVGWVMRLLGRRLHRLTVEGQQATDQLAYVVEENMLAWRSVRLFGGQARQAGASSNAPTACAA
jgi:subfamily B ATP-binding cassette protein MsbA